MIWGLRWERWRGLWPGQCLGRWRGRWRPSLGLVLGGALLATLVLSLAGLVALRYLGPAIGYRNAAVVLALLIAAATAVLGWLLVRLLLRPIRALERYAAAQEAAAAPPAPRHFGTRELHATAHRVIAMAETLRDREATIRAYTDHVTHELKSPVSSIRAAVELFEDGGARSAEELRLIAEIDGARAEIEAQLAALRQSVRARETRYLGRGRLADVAAALGARHPGLALAVEGAEHPLPLAPEGLEIVLAHLLQNAAEHGASAVTLRVAAAGGPLDVIDDGAGISPGNAGRVFDPFFTTRRGAGGTGMGLTIVRSILQAHRARIALRDRPAGTAFRISFAAGAR